MSESTEVVERPEVDDAPTAPEGRPRLRRPRLVALLTAGLVVALVGGGLAIWQLRKGLPGDVAFAVGGTEVSVASVHRRAATLKALYGVEMPAKASKRARFWSDVSQSMVVGRILQQQADARGVVVTDAQADTALQNYVSSMFGQGAEGQQAYVASLGYAGTSDAEVKGEVRRQLVVTALFEKVTAGVGQPGEAEVRAAIQRWSCHLGEPERRRIRNVVVLDRGDADGIVRRLRAGASFAGLARARSSDTSTAAKGGDLGLRTRDELDPAYGRAAFAAKQGQVFGPVRTEHGWNVGLVDRVVPAAPADEATARTEVSARLVADARMARWRAWLERVIARAGVRYAADYRPADPGALPDGVAQPVAAEKLTECSP